MSLDGRSATSRITGKSECPQSEGRPLCRYVRTARLFDTVNVLPNQELPELLDVRIMAMSPQAFTLTGFERVEGVEYAQNCLVSERGG